MTSSSTRKSPSSQRTRRDFATILHANKLKVAALLDPYNAGDTAAKNEVLIHTLGNKNVLRTADVYAGPVPHPEIEDLLRDTLIEVARTELGWDVGAVATSQPTRPIVDVFEAEIAAFSKYRLAKAFLRWTREHTADDLSGTERTQLNALVEAVNRTLK